MDLEFSGQRSGAQSEADDGDDAFDAFEERSPESQDSDTIGTSMVTGECNGVLKTSVMKTHRLKLTSSMISDIKPIIYFFFFFTLV